ncbi:hypothetical protein ACFOZ7_22335 [Natribaculum luteum]|uniref:Uncharacterized protein n=1 Tax=Natribaculum luteum TaxID=1586232 RepID=A0ABD5P5Q9_9EURY|nr:hypothetical protein [Natribaculum luteum]
MVDEVDPDDGGETDERDFSYTGSARTSPPEAGWIDDPDSDDFPFTIDLRDWSEIEVVNEEMYRLLDSNRKNAEEVLAELSDDDDDDEGWE